MVTEALWAKQLIMQIPYEREKFSALPCSDNIVTDTSEIYQSNSKVLLFKSVSGVTMKTAIMHSQDTISKSPQIWVRTATNKVYTEVFSKSLQRGASFFLY